MYLTGDQYNLENRMHQWIQSGADVSAYAAEATGYTGASDTFLYKWERELHHKYREVNGSGYSGVFVTNLGL